MITYPHINSDWAEYKINKFGRALPDVITTLVTEERNGMFELDMQYPQSGENAEHLLIDALVTAKPNPSAENAEPFRIYDIARDIKGVMQVRGRHIVYDTDGIIIEPFRATTVNGIIAKLNTHLNNQQTQFVVQQAGYAGTDAYEMTIKTASSLWYCIGMAAQVMGAELSYRTDPYAEQIVITLHKNRGTNSLATIAYGINLLSMHGSQNSEGVYTSIYPYYFRENTDGTSQYVILPEKIIATGAGGRTRILPVDLTSKFSEAPTVAELRSAANEYVQSTGWNITNSTSFDFVPLESTTEHFETGASQTLNLCDVVPVKAMPIGIYITAKIVKTVFNPLRGKYESLTVGEPQTTVADTIASLEREVRK